ncbi:chloroplastic calcium uniporter protein-like [Carex rostrata]
MATLSRTLAQRFARIIRSASTATATAAGDKSGSLRRFLQKRPIFQPALPPLPYLPSGTQLSDGIKSLNQTRIRLDCLSPPPSKPESDNDEKEIKLTIAEARKVLRASQMEAVRARLKALPGTSVPYTEFIEICNGAAGGAETGSQIAHSLDQSGSVIVLGDTVFLRPELVIKAIESIIPQSKPTLSDPLRGELKTLEDQKAEIDQQAVAQVRRELWCGLGFLVIQTAAFMRLTFWELSWDVMEPICFYVTSLYFMAGYTFFLRTAKEPSFEGFFHSRFASKQKRLMKASNFDSNRFNELKKAVGLPELKPVSCSHGMSNASSPSGFCHCH